MDLHWREYDNGKCMDLYCGCLEANLASLVKATKWWEAVIWLPGIQPKKQYAPLEDQKADVEAQVRHWFDMANTSRPAMERGDEE